MPQNTIRILNQNAGKNRIIAQKNVTTIYQFSQIYKFLIPSVSKSPELHVQ